MISLGGNTTYYFRVRATRGQADSADVPLGSIVTRAAAPTETVVQDVEISSLTLSWSGNGNPADTHYMAQASTDGFATISVTSRSTEPEDAF